MQGHFLRLFVFAPLLLLLAIATPLTAAPFSTSAHPLSSSLEFEVFLGQVGDPNLTSLGSVGPGELTGTVEIDLNLDALGNGTVQFLGSQLQIEDLFGTFDLGVLGAVEYSIEGVVISWATAPIAVVAGNYAAPLIGDVTLTFAAGRIVIDNPTGPIAGLFGTGTILDDNYDVSPSTVGFGSDPNNEFFGIVDTGVGGFVDAAEASFVIPGVIFPLVNLPNSGQISLGYTSEVYVAVPEPSTVMLATLGLAGFVAIGWRRKCRERGNTDRVPMGRIDPSRFTDFS